MKPVIFAGPTLSREEVLSRLDCDCRGPAARGDVYKATLGHPPAIGIIDGYFQGALSVWHKEILWAMSQGIHVFGSSSMGALRAAELHVFGMHGCGAIFADYLSGALEDDDEVAVLHGPSELGFMPLSEPMVNIRATLRRAVAQDIVTSASAQVLCEAAKARFYHDRTWQNLTAGAAAQTLPEGERRRFEDWLQDGRVDIKRKDAEAMLAEMRARLSAGLEPMDVDYSFEWTHLWDGVTAETVSMSKDGSDESGHPSEADVLDEVRLDPGIYSQTRREGLLRVLAAAEARRLGEAVTARELKEGITRFRMDRGLVTRQQLDEWLSLNLMDMPALERLVEVDLLIAALARRAEPAMAQQQLAALRLQNTYPAFHERALSKSVFREQTDTDNPSTDDIDVVPVQIVAWFFENWLRQEIPDDMDKFVMDGGFGDVEDFYRAIISEYLYQKRTDRDSG